MHEKNSLSENCMESYNLYTIRSVNLEVIVFFSKKNFSKRRFTITQLSDI